LLVWVELPGIFRCLLWVDVVMAVGWSSLYKIRDHLDHPVPGCADLPGSRCSVFPTRISVDPHMQTASKCLPKAMQ